MIKILLVLLGLATILFIGWITFSKSENKPYILIAICKAVIFLVLAATFLTLITFLF